MQVAKNKVVSIAYTLTNEDGEVIDQCSTDEPLAYLHGAQNLIPGLENELQGRAVADSFQVTVAPEDGFGRHSQELVSTFSRAEFAEIEDIEVGMFLELDLGEGEDLLVRITHIDGDQITVDGNHELADMNLNFEVTVCDIRDATKDEIEHQHVHGPDCDHEH